MINPDNQTSIDYKILSQMVDTFLIKRLYILGLLYVA